VIRTILVFVLAVAAAIIVYYHFERPQGGERGVDLPESRLPMTAVLGAGGDTSLVVGGRLLRVGVSLITDARCPTGADCVQAGDGRVEVWLRGAGPVTTAQLSTESPRKITLGPLRIELGLLVPHPTVDRRIGRDEYRARLRISRAVSQPDTKPPADTTSS